MFIFKHTGCSVFFLYILKLNLLPISFYVYILQLEEIFKYIFLFIILDVVEITILRRQRLF